MRPNVVRGAGFRGVLNYALSPQKGAAIVGGNLDGLDPRELASEFSISRQLRPECGRPVWHVSLSAAPGEQLTDQQWNEAAEILVESVGLSPVSHQFVAIRHQDTEHDHVHVIASRIGLGGQLWHGQHDAEAAQKASDLIERQLGLVVTRNRNSSEYRPAKTVKCTKRETEMWLRKGVDIPPKYFIAASLEVALQAGAKSWDDLGAALKLDGIDLQKNKRGAGYRISYVEPATGEECLYKASDIGKSYSYKQVARILEENVHGQNRPNPRKGQENGGQRSTERNIAKPCQDEQEAGRDPLDSKDASKPVSVSTFPTEASDFVQPDNGGPFTGGDAGVVRDQGFPSPGKSSELGQGGREISANDARNSAVGAAKSLTVEVDKMDREALKNKVQKAIEEVLAEADGERIELKMLVAALRKRQVETKLHFNQKLKRIMGFGLDLEDEHFQGHEVGIPWQSIRNRIILPEAMKKLDKPTFIISSAESVPGCSLPKSTRQEALEAAKIRAPQIFDGINMSEEDDGWALFQKTDGEVQFYEQPQGHSLCVNKDSYEAVAAALIYGNERWGDGNVVVANKDPRFIEKCLKAADEFGIRIDNREELERIVRGDIQQALSSKEKLKTPLSDYSETLEKLIEYEGYASLGDNEAIKAELRKRLDEMAQLGVDSTPKDIQNLVDKLASQIAYPEQAEAAHMYLQQIGCSSEFEAHQVQRPMDW